MYNVWNVTPLVFEFFHKADSKVGENESQMYLTENICSAVIMNVLVNDAKSLTVKPDSLCFY